MKILGFTNQPLEALQFKSKLITSLLTSNPCVAID